MSATAGLGFMNPNPHRAHSTTEKISFGKNCRSGISYTTACCSDPHKLHATFSKRTPRQGSGCPVLARLPSFPKKFYQLNPENIYGSNLPEGFSRETWPSGTAAGQFVFSRDCLSGRRHWREAAGSSDEPS